MTYEQEREFERYLRERERKKAQATGKAIADVICETPVVREVATVVTSVLSILFS